MSDESLFCAGCSKELPRGQGQLVVMKCIWVNDPFPQELDADLTAEEIAEEIRRLCESFDDISSREAMEDVCSARVLFFCPGCHKEFLDRYA